MQLAKYLLFLLVSLLIGPAQAGPTPYPVDGLPRGAAIYTAYCSACHGDDGDGCGPMVGQLPTDSSPTNLTSWIFQGSRSDQTIRQAILGGGSAVHKSDAMPAWSQTLTDRQVDDLVAYVRGLKRGAAPDLVNVGPLEDELQIGKALYSIRCLACHGATGEGHGFLLDSLVSSGTAPVDVLMPDFSLYSTFRGRSDDDFAALISSGISHSGLALQTSNGWWNRPLELAELRALILYLRTLPKE